MAEETAAFVPLLTNKENTKIGGVGLVVQIRSLFSFFCFCVFNCLIANARHYKKEYKKKKKKKKKRGGRRKRRRRGTNGLKSVHNLKFLQAQNLRLRSSGGPASASTVGIS
eukprot:TRINITY_DN134_c1_g1_i2.p1 TRINITY_DN134_c1_g1~~TRINITY_DN134_c1_g1_i2.p1  ORF type:complete len:111 (-),score=13.87 TRINITY_DN134_c1_g1_i2:746-1078(-)